MAKSLKYSIEKYNFKKGKYYGSVLIRGENNLKDIFRKIFIKFDKKDLHNKLEDFEKYFNEVLIEILKEGYAVNLNDYIKLIPVVRGLFKGTEDTFDPDRHNIEISAEPIKNLNNVKVKKVIE